MTYQTTRLSFTPALYWRLDMVGTVADADVVPDLSGNGLDGEVNLLAGTAGGPGVSPGDGVVPFMYPYGQPSPIETDPASRAFAGHNFNTGPDTEQARIFVASDPLIEPSNNFTLDGWVNVPRADMGNDVSNGVTQQHLFGKFNVAEIYIDTFSKLAGAIKDSAGNFFRVVAQTNFIVGRWYYVVLVRLGNALALYVDRQLQATTTITSGLGSSIATPDFMVHTSQVAPADCLYTMVAFQLNALSGADVATIHESAFNDLLARGECHIRTTAVIQGSVEPDAIAYPFRTNWITPVIERLSWRTSVYKPTNGATELGRQRLAPRRTIEYSHLLYDEELRRRYEARAFGGRTAIVQFEPDKVQVASLSAGATTATLDTTLRDFEVGHHVLFYQTDDLYEYATLLTVTDTAITWDEPLTRDYVNVWVKPARVARMSPATQMDQHTDTVGESSTIYALDEADEPLTPRRITPFTPTLTYHDRDLWDLAAWQGHNYVEIPEWEWAADRSELDSTTGLVSTKTYRWGAETLQPWNMLLNGRAAIAAYLGWLYERRGQYSPFWMPTFKQDLKPLGGQGTQLMVKGHEYSNLYASADNRLDLAFVYWDNTYTCARIVDLVVGDGVDLLYLDMAVPTFTNLRWLCFLRRVVLSSDDLELAWETDDKMRVAFAVADAPLDTVAGSPSVSPSPSASGSRSPSPSPSFSPSASLSPSASQSISPSSSASPSGSQSPSASVSPSLSPSASTSPSSSASPSA